MLLYRSQPCCLEGLSSHRLQLIVALSSLLLWTPMAAPTDVSGDMIRRFNWVSLRRFTRDKLVGLIELSSSWPIYMRVGSSARSSTRLIYSALNSVRASSTSCLIFSLNRSSYLLLLSSLSRPKALYLFHFSSSPIASLPPVISSSSLMLVFASIAVLLFCYFFLSFLLYSALLTLFGLPLTVSIVLFPL